MSHQSSQNEGAWVYDSSLDLANMNDPRTVALGLIGSDKSVLELGPATGRVTRVLHERRCRVVALERDAAMAPNLKAYCARVVVGDIETLSLEEIFDEQRFDVILAGDFLEHLTHPLKLLRELKTFLTADGFVVASIPNIAHGSVRLSLLQGKFDYKQIGILDHTHLRFFTYKTILQLFADAGFAVIEVHRVHQDPFREPYVEGPSLDVPDLPSDIKQLIAEDPDASTVQFVVKALPMNSYAAQQHVLLELQCELQEKERTAIRLHKLVEEQEQLIAEIPNLQRQIHSYWTQLEATRRRLDQREKAVRELQANNELLAAWLTKYKNLKEKLLPSGSFRDRLLRKVATLRPKAAPAAVELQKAPAAREVQFATVSDPEAIIEPPAAWLDDPLRPPVVIAIANWNRVQLLTACINSIVSNTKYNHYRISVYEQGSTDGSQEYLKSLGNRVDTVFAAKNIGFVGANNAIIRRYPKWDVVFLNNDTRVTEGWLEPLVETAYSAAAIGLVGCKLVYPSGVLQEAGSQIFADGSARAFGKYEHQWEPEFNQLREVDYCSAACLYAKRELLDNVGGFDERYSPAYYEDSDLAFSARASGFKVLYQPKSVVIHEEYGTSGTAASHRMAENRQKFVDKWSSVLSRQRKNLWEAVAVDERDKILVIHDLLPSPDRSSGGRRLYELLRLLARHYHVVLAYLHPHQVKEYLKPLEQYGITVFYPGYAKAVRNDNLDLKAILLNNDFKFVFCELYTVAQQYIDLVRSCSPNSKVVVDTFDVHFLREMRKAELLNDAELRACAAATEERELNVYRRADLVITVTEDDKKVLLQKDSGLPVRVIPNIHSLPQENLGRAGRTHLLFVGGFSHEPNVDAMLYFCWQIFPLVRATIPGIKLIIVGNAPPAEIVTLASDAILVKGHVANLNLYLQSALISIAPLRYGSGMKGKVGEAMAYGLPVVTTSIGAEGMDLLDGVDALIADDPQEFANCIIRLHQDAALWEKLATNGRLRVEREWSPSAVEAKLCSALEADFSMPAAAALPQAR